MMASSQPVAQFDLGTVRSPIGNDERLAVRCAVAALIGLAVGAAFLAVTPVVPKLVSSAWCVGRPATGCDPGSRITGQLIDLVIWSVVLAGTATVVSAPLGFLAAAIDRVRVRVGMALVLLGPPMVWIVVVLGAPFGMGLHLMRSPWILAQAGVGYLMAGLLTAPGPRPKPLWRLLTVAGLVLGTAAVIALGYPFD